MLLLTPRAKEATTALLEPAKIQIWKAATHDDLMVLSNRTSSTILQ